VESWVRILLGFIFHHRRSHLAGANFSLLMAYIYLRRMRRLIVMRLVAMLFLSCVVLHYGGHADGPFTDQSVFIHGPGGYIGDLLYNRTFNDILGIFGTALIMGRSIWWAWCSFSPTTSNRVQQIRARFP